MTNPDSSPVDLTPGLLMPSKALRALTNLPALSRAGVWGRGALYIFVAALTDLLPFLAADTKPYWPFAICKVFLASAVTLRAYIDQSPAQSEPDDADETDA